MKRRLNAKVTEAESKMEEALGRCTLLEKTKQRLQQDSEDLVLELERSLIYVHPNFTALI